MEISDQGNETDVDKVKSKHVCEIDVDKVKSKHVCEIDVDKVKSKHVCEIGVNLTHMCRINSLTSPRKRVRWSNPRVRYEKKNF